MHTDKLRLLKPNLTVLAENDCRFSYSLITSRTVSVSDRHASRKKKRTNAGCGAGFKHGDRPLVCRSGQSSRRRYWYAKCSRSYVLVCDQYFLLKLLIQILHTFAVSFSCLFLFSREGASRNTFKILFSILGYWLPSGRNWYKYIAMLLWDSLATERSAAMYIQYCVTFIGYRLEHLSHVTLFDRADYIHSLGRAKAGNSHKWLVASWKIGSAEFEILPAGTKPWISRHHRSPGGERCGQRESARRSS